jgi:hypothetical protein
MGDGQYSPQQFKVEANEANGIALDQQTASMMTTAHDPATGKMVWQCTQCTYSNKLKFTVKEHVETHISGIVHNCPHCTKTCPTRNALRVHTIRNHSNAPKTPVQPKENHTITNRVTERVKIRIHQPKARPIHILKLSKK